MFILKDEVKAWWTVKVKEPHPKIAGKFQTHEFEVEFTLLNQDEANAIAEERAALLKDDEMPDADIVRAIQAFDAQQYVDRISNWRGVFDEDRREVPYSSDLLLQALKRPLIQMAIAEAYEDMASGGGRRKN